MSIYGNSFWEIIKPAEGLNLVQNPSIEKNILGYAGASGGAAASTSASQFYGSYGLQVTPTSASSDGVYYGANSIGVYLVTGIAYSFSAFFKGQAGIPYSLFFANTSGVKVGSSLDFTATGNWERKAVTYVETSSASRRLYVTKNNSANTGVFIIDGVQCEQVGGAGASPTTYMDGDQPGCVWLATSHKSQSWRDGQSRAGGQIINLNRDYDIIVRQQPGAGMPPVQNIQTGLGVEDGALFQRARAQVRTITLDGIITGSDISDFHYNRNRLIDLFKPNAGADGEAFLLRYTSGSSVTKQIKAYYDSGFEMNPVTANIETFSVRFLAYDPYWEEIKTNAQAITTVQLSVPRIEPLFRSYGGNEGGLSLTDEGNWVATASNVAGILKYDLGPDNWLYYIMETPGSGSHQMGRANVQDSRVGTDPAHVIDYEFLPATAGCHLLSDNIINAFAFDAQGNLYIGGDFTSAGSISASRIVKWNGTDFEAVIDGVDDAVTAIAFDKNNTLYIGGNFANAGSIAACTMAKLPVGATEFSQVGDGFDGGSGCIISDIQFEKSGSNFYVSGSFTSSGSISVCGLAYFNGVEFTNIGSACINGRVKSVAIKPDDTVFFGGLFTGTFPDSAGSPSYLSYWDGISFGMGAEVSPNTCVTKTSYDEETGLLAVGLGGSSLGGAKPLSNAGIYLFWNGSTWIYSSYIEPVSTREVTGLINTKGFHGVSIYGIGGGLTTATPIISTVNNPGGATVYPELIFNLPTTTTSDILYYVENISASKIIQFDYTILAGETLTIDTKSTDVRSSVRGNSIGSILPGSNFTTWQFLPGNNRISAFAESASTTFIIRWKNRHWSIDGGES